MPTRLADVRRYALSLPEAAESPQHQMSSSRVRGEILATLPPGGLALHLFVDETRREAAIAAEPVAFEKLWWRHKVAGLRVVLAQAPRPAVKALLLSAWRHKAPAKLTDPP